MPTLIGWIFSQHRKRADVKQEALKEAAFIFAERRDSFPFPDPATAANLEHHCTFVN